MFCDLKTLHEFNVSYIHFFPLEQVVGGAAKRRPDSSTTKVLMPDLLDHGTECQCA